MGTVSKICHQDKNTKCTGYSCQSPWSAPRQLSWKILLTSGKAQKELMSPTTENQNYFSSPAPPPPAPSKQTQSAMSQPALPVSPSPPVGGGRGLSSPMLWTMFLRWSRLKLNQEWMIQLQRGGKESSSCIGLQQPPPP